MENNNNKKLYEIMSHEEFKKLGLTKTEKMFADRHIYTKNGEQHLVKIEEKIGEKSETYHIIPTKF
jgi:hypothetical protein